MSPRPWTSLAGWLALAAIAALGVGGAAARPEGALLGLPGPAAAGAMAGGLILLLGWLGSAGAGPAFGLVPLLALVLSGPPLSGARALSGAPLLALALAGVALAVAHRRPRLPRLVFLPTVFAIYAVAAGRVQVQVGPQGDEPHYLMVAESLLRDGDLALEKDYAESRYLKFTDGPLAPHYRLRGKGGEILSLHAPGLSLLVLPAYALGGYPVASLFLALLAALLAHEIRELIRRWWGDDAGAEGLAWTLALSPPLVHYAGLVFTEAPAALAVAIALRRAPDAREWGAGTALGVGAAIAFLPWLNVRYAPLGALLLAYAFWHRPRLRRAAALVAPVVVSALASALYHHALYGFYDPRRVYGRRPELSLRTLPEGLPGVLLDQEFGLLVYAPVFALALPGLVLLWRKDRRTAVTAGALSAVVLLTASSWHMWRGGFNPPARFLLPLVPVLGLAVAATLARGVSASAALLIGWGLWTGLVGAWEPRLVHRDRDGTAPFFRAHSGAEEWTRLLPGYVLADPDRRSRALVWGVALAAAAFGGKVPASAGRLAAASLSLVIAASVASAVSKGRAGGRDAVRLVGRAALAVPGWTWISSAPGRWGPAELDWGPLYEPHRHPGGAPVGLRLPLPPGRYRFALEAEDLASSLPPPRLVVRPDARLAPRSVLLQRGAGGLAARFDVQPDDRAVTLLLQGGGPWRLQSFLLETQPFPVAPGPSD